MTWIYGSWPGSKHVALSELMKGSPKIDVLSTLVQCYFMHHTWTETCKILSVKNMCGDCAT